MKGRVLLVEDDTHIRGALTIILTNAGYSVIQAGLVSTALMHLDVFDLVAVVLDLRLPNGLGFKIVDELKAKRDDVPVVILSGWIHDKNEFEQHHGPMAWPIVEVLTKPTKRELLLQAVARAANHSEAIKSLRLSARAMSNFTGVN